jgi:hypothetical protein
MSVAETCRTNVINPFEYMLAVVGNAAAAKASPQQWMPWNFLVALAKSTAPAV